MSSELADRPTKIKHLGPERQAKEDEIEYLKHLRVVKIVSEHELRPRPIQQSFSDRQRSLVACLYD